MRSQQGAAAPGTSPQHSRLDATLPRIIREWQAPASLRQPLLAICRDQPLTAACIIPEFLERLVLLASVQPQHALLVIYQLWLTDFGKVSKREDLQMRIVGDIGQHFRVVPGARFTLADLQKKRRPGELPLALEVWGEAAAVKGRLGMLFREGLVSEANAGALIMAQLSGLGPQRAAELLDELREHLTQPGLVHSVAGLVVSYLVKYGRKQGRGSSKERKSKGSSRSRSRSRGRAGGRSHGRSRSRSRSRLRRDSHGAGKQSDTKRSSRRSRSRSRQRGAGQELGASASSPRHKSHTQQPTWGRSRSPARSRQRSRSPRRPAGSARQRSRSPPRAQQPGSTLAPGKEPAGTSSSHPALRNWQAPPELVAAVQEVCERRPHVASALTDNAPR
jgi:hypothetical protein